MESTGRRPAPGHRRFATSFASWLLAPVLVAASAPLASAQGFVVIRGEPGEFMTGGATFSYDPSNSTTGFGITPGGMGCTVYSPAKTWDFRFFGQGHHALGSGVYHAPGGNTTGNEARITIGYGIKACIPIADFQVRRLAWKPDGFAREVWIVWGGRCTAGQPGISGEIRLAADTTLWQEHPGDVFAFGGDSATFTTVAHCAGGNPVRFVVDTLPSGASFVDPGDGTAEFRWRAPVVSTPTLFPVRVIATNDAGANDTTTTWIHAMPAMRAGYVSQPGDGMGKGVPDTLRDPRTEVVIRESGTVHPPLSVQLKVGGRGWTLEYQAPMNRPLAEGSYENSQGSPSSALVRPGFAFTTSGNTWSCYEEEGRFEIRRLRRDAAGAVTGIWAVIEGRCVGASGAVRAEFVYDIDTTLYVRAPADRFVEPGDSVTFEVQAVRSRPGAASLAHGVLPQGAVFEWSAPGRGVFRWRAPDAPVSELPVSFFALADDGSTDTVTTHLHVVPVARFALAGQPGHCVVNGTSFLGTGTDGDFRGLPGKVSEARAWYQSTNDRYELWLYMPTGQAVGKGDYPLLRRSPYDPSPIWAGLQTAIGGSGYTPGLANLQVRKYARDAGGTLTSLWALWSWWCGDTPNFPVARGELRLNADTTIYTRAPAFQPVERGRPVHFVVRSVQALGAPSHVDTLGLPGGATFVAAADSATFDWPAAAPVGPAEATFVSSDGAGHADTLTTRVLVMEPRWLRFDADPGEWATGGGLYQWDATNADFGSFNDGNGMVSIQVHSWRDSWVARFGAPASRPLAPGYFEGPRNADIYALRQSPRFTAIRNGRSSFGSGVGWFHVRKVELANDGRPTRLWAVFDVGPSGQRIRGEVLYGDPDTTLYLTAPGDRFVNPGDSVAFTVRASHARHRPVALSAAGGGADAVFHDLGDGTATFAWRAPATEGVDVPVKILAVDDEGLRDSCLVVVHVVVPGSLVTHSPDPLERIGRGVDRSADARAAEFRMYPFGANGVTVEVRTAEETWNLTVRAPDDAPLAPGAYPDAVGSWYARASDAVFDIRLYGLGSDCALYGVGAFTVHDIGRDSAGVVNRLWLSFEDRCDAAAPALTGELRIGTFDAATPTIVSRREATFEGGVVHLAWRVAPGTSGAFRVDRHAPGDAAGEWRPLATLVPGDGGNLAWTDADVGIAGAYAYRLVGDGPAGGVLDQVDVQVGGASPFAIASLGPNPVRDALTLRASAPQAETVEVTVADVSGRIVLRRTLAATGAAPHQWDLPLPRSLPAGIYLLRARCGDVSQVRRFVRVR